MNLLLLCGWATGEEKGEVSKEENHWKDAMRKHALACRVMSFLGVGRCSLSDQTLTGWKLRLMMACTIAAKELERAAKQLVFSLCRKRKKEDNKQAKWLSTYHKKLSVNRVKLQVYLSPVFSLLSLFSARLPSLSLSLSLSQSACRAGSCTGSGETLNA